jgi:hypothetical protein
MSPEDFPQFDDPRVREVFAAAANACEKAGAFIDHEEAAYGADARVEAASIAITALKTALFAAQHSKPKNECANCGDYREAAPGSDHCQECLDDIAAGEAREAAQHSKPATHEKPVEFDKWGFGKPVTNRFDVDGSKPGGKAFIAAVDHGMMCNCPKCVYK